MPKHKIAVVGAGAAGFFGALRAASLYPDAEVCIFEKSSQALAKVRVSGGGRCNVTHHCFEIPKLLGNYPRGASFLKQVFKRFAPKDTIEWFKQRQVQLKVEDDGRMFPTSDSSQTIIDCFLKEAQNLGVKLYFRKSLLSIQAQDKGFYLSFADGSSYSCDALLLAMGGNVSNLESLVHPLGHTVIPARPSLFTLNCKNFILKDLAGISLQNAQLKVEGSKLQQRGPLLITHWGLSGPAALKLSAWGAIEFFEKNYQFGLFVNWSGLDKEEEVREALQAFKTAHPKKQVGTQALFEIPKRLWDKLLHIQGIEQNKLWLDLSKRELNLLVEACFRFRLEVEGKTTFKEEFVTAGGISLAEVDAASMQSKKAKGLFFAGEMLDIDAVTGGFNFQAAWSCSWVAAEHLLSSPKNSLA